MVKKAAMIVKVLRLMIVMIIFSIATSCSKHIIPGKYGTNFATYGMFGKTLTLNCDSSMIMNFAGDLQNDNSLGKWMLIKDTLILRFDTINYPNSRYKDDLYFLTKKNKLLTIPLTKTKYGD